MGAYQYVAVDGGGKEHRGVLEGDTPKHVRQILRERKLLPVDVSEVESRERTTGPRQWSPRRGISSLDLALLTRSRNRPVTAWLVARLPADSNTRTRSPGISKKVIFRNVLTWSTPALVRESDRNTRPSSTWTPMQ